MLQLFCTSNLNLTNNSVQCTLLCIIGACKNKRSLLHFILQSFHAPTATVKTEKHLAERNERLLNFARAFFLAFVGHQQESTTNIMEIYKFYGIFNSNIHYGKYILSVSLPCSLCRCEAERYKTNFLSVTSSHTKSNLNFSLFRSLPLKSFWANVELYRKSMDNHLNGVNLNLQGVGWDGANLYNFSFLLLRPEGWRERQVAQAKFARKFRSVSEERSVSLH